MTNASNRVLGLLLGTIRIDKEVHTATAYAGPSIVTLLERHSRNDWGDVTIELRSRNQFAVLNGLKIKSYYRLKGGQIVCIRTNSARTETRCDLEGTDAEGMQ